jgi:hypothetical protein
MNRNTPPTVWTIVGIFLISRLIIPLFGIHLDYSALFKNWQYLDVTTLKTNIWAGIWFDHTQPPVFNLLLSAVLHLTGSGAPLAFSLLFKLISLVNALLLFALLRQTVRHPRLPLFFTLLYLLSPASIIFENELFYTSFISMLLLISCFFLLDLPKGIRAGNAIGFLLPLVLVALTRSMYHILLLFILCALVIGYYRKVKGARLLVALSILSLAGVGSWYVKNYILFRTFSTSSWMGMNLARNVFHDAVVTDSTRIETIEPFSNISAYEHFRSPQEEQQYRGLNDRDLLQEYKNDSFWNEKHVGYLRVSQVYMAASKQAIRNHPGAYLKNVLQSTIIFFAPATRYPPSEYQAAKIKYYDLVYSFNLSHFAHGKQQRRLALTLSALPRLLFYCLIFLGIAKQALREKKIPCLTLFITIIIGYIFCIGSFFEHYENMRFRYEAEPLFLILAAGVVSNYLLKRNRRIELPKDGLPERA